MKYSSQSLEKSKKTRVAKLIGLPGEDDDLFPEWDAWLKLEADGGSASDVAPAAVNGHEGVEEAEVEAEAEAEEEDE